MTDQSHPTEANCKQADRIYIRPPRDLKSRDDDAISAWARALHAALMEQMDPDGSKRAAARQAATDTSEA